VNVEHLRRSLKTTWLRYYRDNRPWLVRLGVWVDYEGQRRPSSSFILATLSTLEPQFIQLLPLIVDLSSNPDRIVSALGLNFSPDAELEKMTVAEGSPDTIKLLPSGSQPIDLTVKQPPSKVSAAIDEACHGVGGDRD